MVSIAKVRLNGSTSNAPAPDILPGLSATLALDGNSIFNFKYLERRVNQKIRIRRHSRAEGSFPSGRQTRMVVSPAQNR